MRPTPALAALAALLLAGAAGPAPAPAASPPAAEWDARWYNPKPAEGDLVLPLPCGGAVAFRPVDVPSGPGPLDDRRVTLGQPDPAAGYAEYQRLTHLAAPFAAPGGGRRYWMGKYAVTRDQYAALRGEPCQAPTPAGRVPQASLAWSEAVEWSVRWSAWLLKNARAKLPRNGDAIAYARLPTDDEWEYAARGGTAVGEDAFLAPTWPMPEGIERYAMAGTRVAGGRAQQVGQLLPNPLGLYDMLGNVDQMVLDPFRLNRVGRPHGAAGGVTIRGGNYSSTPSGLRTSMRAEVPLLDAAKGEPTRLPTVGFRLVLSAGSVGGLADIERVRQDFERESATRQQAVNDPRQVLALLRETTRDDALRGGLDRIGASLAAQERERADQARAALDAQIEAAVVLAMNVWSQSRVIAMQLELAGKFKEQEAEIRARAASNRRQQAGSLDGYMRLLRQAASGPARDSLAARAEVVRQELRGRGQGYLVPFLDVLERQVLSLAGSAPTTREKALAEIAAIPAAEGR